jgi:hypothetical protein
MALGLRWASPLLIRHGGKLARHAHPDGRSMDHAHNARGLIAKEDRLARKQTV